MFRPRASRSLLIFPVAALLLLSAQSRVRAQSFVPATTGFTAEIKVWTSENITYAKVRLTFPNLGYTVSDWGQVVRSGNSFIVDARIEQYTGASGQAIMIKERTYTLGTLAPGTYSFTFKSYGTTINSQQFDPSQVVEQWEAVTLSSDRVGIIISTTNGLTSARVILRLPDVGYSVRDWGQFARSGNDYSDDIKLEHFVGQSQPSSIIAEQEYQLGALASGTYSFTVRISGSTIRIQQFTIGTPTSTAPKLLCEGNSDRAIALDSVTWLRRFQVLTGDNFSPDHHARIMLFATAVNFAQGESTSALTAQAEDAQHNIYPLTVEYVGKVPGFDWVTQIVVKLPDDLKGGGDVWVTISLHGLTSNKAMITISPSAGSQ